MIRKDLRGLDEATVGDKVRYSMIMIFDDPKLLIRNEIFGHVFISFLSS